MSEKQVSKRREETGYRPNGQHQNGGIVLNILLRHFLGRMNEDIAYRLLMGRERAVRSSQYALRRTHSIRDMRGASISAVSSSTSEASLRIALSYRITSVVGARYGAEPLLPGSVPDLRFNSLALDVD